MSYTKGKSYKNIFSVFVLFSLTQRKRQTDRERERERERGCWRRTRRKKILSDRTTKCKQISLTYISNSGYCLCFFDLHMSLCIFSLSFAMWVFFSISFVWVLSVQLWSSLSLSLSLPLKHIISNGFSFFRFYFFSLATFFFPLI